MGVNFWKGNQEICGVEWKVARQLCSEASYRLIDPSALAGKALFLKEGYGESELAEAMESLVLGGYLRKTEGGYVSTSEGSNVLAKARWGKPITRNEANSLLAECLERSCAYNGEDYPYTITELRVFGSFLEHKDELGDLDISLVVEERRRRPHRKGWELDYAPSHCGTIVDKLFYAKRECCRFVKGGRKPASVSMQDLDDLGVEYLAFSINEYGRGWRRIGLIFSEE